MTDLLGAEAYARADGRGIYVTFETADPINAARALPLARIDASGFGMLRVDGDAVALITQRGLLTFRCSKTSVGRELEPLRLGLVEPPSGLDEPSWQRAERLFQHSDPGAKDAYDHVSKRKLRPYAELRLADLALLSGAEDAAMKRYSALIKEGPREVSLLARATSDEIALWRGEHPRPIETSDEALSQEAAYRLARVRLLQGDDRQAERLLLTAGSVTVMGLRNLAFAERIRADRMRERFLVGDDEAVVRALSADPPLALRPLLMHAWLALDDATEVLARIEESDRVAGPLGLLAVDAEIDLGRCKEAHAHLLTQARDRRVAFRLKRLNAMLNEMQTEMPSDSATSCRKETP